MNLRTIPLGLAAIFSLFGGPADAKSLLSYVLPHALTAKQPHESNGYRSGTLDSTDATSLYSADQRKTSFAACADLFPGKRPLDVNRFSPALKPMALCSDTFAVVYSQTSKTPLVVTERLTASQLADAKGEERTNQFYPDPRIPESGRAELSDYRGQSPAVDRGHQAPAADAPNHRAMAQSFALSNMVPQDPESNRKAWSDIEKATRKFAQRASGNVFVFTGPIFDAGHATIGTHQVWKPTRLFKLVYDEQSRRAWAYIQPNAAAPVSTPVDYATFIRTTGLRLLDGHPVTGTIAR